MSNPNMIEISIDTGFTPFTGNHGVSSNVFFRGDNIFKLTTRNRIERAISDYSGLQEIFNNLGFSDKIQESEIFECINSEGKVATCIRQKLIHGKTIAELDETDLQDYLSNNPNEVDFLRQLLQLSLDRILDKKLYPDLVGNPSNQSLGNSINMIINRSRGIVLCDVGLSPHEDTLKYHGMNFFATDSATHYAQKIGEGLNFLKGF